METFLRLYTNLQRYVFWVNRLYPYRLNASSEKALVVTDKDRLHYLPLLLMTERKFTNEVLNSHFLASAIIGFLFSFTC